MARKPQGVLCDPVLPPDYDLREQDFRARVIPSRVGDIRALLGMQGSLPSIQRAREALAARRADHAANYAARRA